MVIKIKNNTNGKELTLRGVDNWIEEVSQDVWQMDFPEAVAKDLLTLRLSGQQMKISFTSLLFDSDEDLSNGYNIKTKEEQRQFLCGSGGDTSNSIFTPGVDDTWTLTIGTETFTCIIESIRITKRADNPEVYEANFSVIIGGV